MLVNNGECMLFMCSVNVATVKDLISSQMHLSDLPLNDGTRDLIMLNQSRLSQVELNKQLEETRKNLKQIAAELETEKQKTDDLLKEMMPPTVADALREGISVEACEFSEVTLLFTDIVTFTNISALCTPYDVVALLNDLYMRFDHIAGLHDVYKVETIGDAYMVAAGVPTWCADHSERTLNTAIGLLMESKQVLSPVNQKPIRIRIGVHSGPVVAGVVGLKMPRYCLFGDTVYCANRMESCGQPAKIHVSEAAKRLGLQTNPSFVFADRGLVEIPLKGPMQTHFLERNDRKSVWELTGIQRGEAQTIDGYMELHDQSVYALNEMENNSLEAKQKPKKINFFKKHLKEGKNGILNIYGNNDMKKNENASTEKDGFATDVHDTPICILL